MATTLSIPRLNCCSFCHAPGHRIDACQHENIELYDQRMLKAVATTAIFPFIGTEYIKYQLKTHSHVELKALRYKFKLPENSKNLVKTKVGLITHLTKCYSNMINNGAMYERYIQPIVTQIYANYQFLPNDPDLRPDTEYITTFAGIVNHLVPYNDSFSVKVLEWQARQVARYYADKQNYVAVFQPHKFNIITIVTPVTHDDKVNTFECPICYQDDLMAMCSAKMTCGHSYCNGCMENYLESKSNERKQTVVPRCGMCREVIQDIHFKDGEKAEAINKKYVNPSGRL